MMFLIRMGNHVYIQMELATSLRTLLGCVQLIFIKGNLLEVTIFRSFLYFHDYLMVAYLPFVHSCLLIMFVFYFLLITGTLWQRPGM